VSSTTLAMSELEPEPARIVLLVILLSPPPDVSIAKKTSSLAAVDISVKSPTTVGLKFVPSAISKAPAVLVAIVRSSPPIVRSPASVALAPLNVKAVVVPDLITKLPELFVSEPKVVPASFTNTSPPSASSITSPDESIVTSVPSLIIVSRAILPTLVILASPNEVAASVVAPDTVKEASVVAASVVAPETARSVPTYNFLAILAPPSVRNAPVSPVASLASVASVTSSMPLKVSA